jgi:hypothetical protein
MRGLAQPSTEVVEACFAPHVWIWRFVLASLRVAWLCFVACVCGCTPFCFRLAGLFFRLSLCKIYPSIYPSKRPPPLHERRKLSPCRAAAAPCLGAAAAEAGKR